MAPRVIHRLGGAQQREWAFLVWWALGDVVKHTRRGSLWRALSCLDEARALAWKLHAASLAVEYPDFGAVSVENAGLPAPARMQESLPARAEAGIILGAARALADVLGALTADLDVSGLQQIVTVRLAGGQSMSALPSR